MSTYNICSIINTSARNSINVMFILLLKVCLASYKSKTIADSVFPIRACNTLLD